MGETAAARTARVTAPMEGHSRRMIVIERGGNE
jgi:hypothetical protein